MDKTLLHREVCRLRVAQEESCRRSGSRRRLKLWNVSVQRTTAALLLEWTCLLSNVSAEFDLDTIKMP